MKNPLIKLTSNEDQSNNEWGAPVYVSVFTLQGIEPGEVIYESDSDPTARHTFGTGERSIGRGALVWWSDQCHNVRESVVQVERMVRAKLKELSTR